MSRSTTIDEDEGTVTVATPAGTQTWSLGSADGFAAVSNAWLRSGWDAKYVYSFTWLGRPIIQLPEDMIRIQEIIYRVKPDAIVETGVAHGGSLVFYASVLKAMGRGRVVGVDIEIRPANRTAIETHELAGAITLIEGNSVDVTTVEQVSRAVTGCEKVLVVLDSCHEREHVLRELEAYSTLVGHDSYIVVCDGIMESLVGAPRSKPDWASNNPRAAIADFLASHHEFVAVEPTWLFNEGEVRTRVTYWPKAFLRRRV